MIKKTINVTRQVMVGILATALIGWFGSLVGYCFHWSASVDSQLAEARSENTITRATDDDHWTAVLQALNIMNQHLSEIDHRLDSRSK